MSGQTQWARFFGPKAVSGLLIGCGLLMIVFTQFLLPQWSKVGFIFGIGLIVIGIIGFLIDHKSER